jgi:hypothetical protein
MQKYFIALLLVFSIATQSNAQKSQVWMLGPMLHFNFSNKVMHTSFGVELAYWNYTHFPYSFDFGIEFEKKKFRIYSEAQTGIGLIGLSMGPVLEYQSDENKMKLGAQGSVWANYFGGFDLRFRKVGGTSSLSPGLYFKIPLGYGGDADGDDDWDWDWDD